MTDRYRFTDAHPVFTDCGCEQCKGALARRAALRVQPPDTWLSWGSFVRYGVLGRLWAFALFVGYYLAFCAFGVVVLGLVMAVIYGFPVGLARVLREIRW